MTIFRSHPHKLSRWRQLALLLVVAATVIAAFMSSNFAQDAKDRLDRVTAAQKALDEDQATFDAQIDCTQKVLRDTLDALKARSAFAETSANIELVLLQAQAIFLATAPISNIDSAEAIRAYVKAVQTAITAIDEQLRVRDLNPFPTLAEINLCFTTFPKKEKANE